MKIRVHSALIVFTIFFLSLIMSGCVNNLFYYPDRIVYRTPSQYNFEYEDVLFQSKDGTKLHGWFVPAVGTPAGTVIHFHGNAQNITAHFGFVEWLPAHGFNLFTFDYRGYGKSEGRPNRQGLYEDCIAAIDYIKTRTDLNQNRLFILGQSLGGANAIAVLGKKKFSGIQAAAIDSAFYSYRTIVRDKIGNIPLICLLKWPLSFLVVSNKHSPGYVVGQISPLPLLLIHGTADKVIPYHHTKWLFDRAKNPKYLWTIDGGQHTETLTKFRSQYGEKLIRFYRNALENK